LTTTIRRNGYDVEYVNTKKGSETDFFARHRISKKVQLIQVCWDMSDKKTVDRELRGLESAMGEFSVSSGTVVSWDDEISLDSKINVVPIWKWLLS